MTPGQPTLQLSVIQEETRPRNLQSVDDDNDEHRTYDESSEGSRARALSSKSLLARDESANSPARLLRLGSPPRRLALCTLRAGHNTLHWR